MDTSLKILMLEDVETDAELAARELRRAQIDFTWRRVETRNDFLHELHAFVPDLIVSDYSLPGFDGLSALEIAQQACPDTPFLFLSGTIGEETAIESLKRGAADYVLKTNMKRLAAAVRRAISEKRERHARLQAEKQLKESEERFRTLASHAPVGIFYTGPQGENLYVNKCWSELTAMPPEQARGKGWTHAPHPEDRLRVTDAWQVAILARQPFIAEFRVGAPGGKINWVVSTATAQYDSGGNVSGYIGTVVDITERKHYEQRIARLNRIHEVLSSINSAIVRMRSRQELFEEACRIAVDHGQFKLAWIGLVDPDTRRIVIQAHAGMDDAFLQALDLSADAAAPEGQGITGNTLRSRQPGICNDIATDGRLRLKNENLARGHRSLAALPLIVDGDAIGIITLYASEPGYFNADEMKLLNELAGDVSFALDYLRKDEKLNYLAYYDLLTGLPNRDLCNDRLNQCIRAANHYGQIVALLVLDIERLSVVNDKFGRHAGDALLKLVARRLQEALPEPGALARIGADNFAVVVSEIDREADAVNVLEERIRRHLAAPFDLEGSQLRVSVKAGIAVYPNDGETADALFTNAEAALKKAKLAGERHLFYAPQMNATLAERLALENRLRRALEERQFVLHYQAKVNTRNNRIESLEALMRWHDPEAGLVQPMKFIPVLEESGMIIEAGRWALEQAASDFIKLAACLPSAPRIAVNVSSVQLRQKNFVAEVAKVIREFGQERHGLDLEITESLIMQNIEDTIPKLRMLRDMKIKVAIDDFGTGYSSFSYIARLPLDALKIDRAFITNMANNPDDKIIVSSIISLAHALNLKVVAEGVETQEQSQLLKLLDCDEAQGYFYGKPLALDVLIPVLAGQSADAG